MSATLAFYLVLSTFLVLLVLSPLILTLFGFFETRANGRVTFKFARYVGSILVSIIASATLLPVLALTLTQLTIDGEATAVDSAKLNRATQLQFQESAGSLFPVIKEKNDCYTKALSNWIEDHWQTAYREAACNQGTCASNEDDYINLLNQKNPLDKYDILSMMGLSFDMKGKAVNNIWAAAKHMYSGIRSFLGIVDPTEIGKPKIGTDNAAYDEYNSYIKRCQAMQPKSWMVSKEPLIISPISLCIGECP